MRNIIFAVPVSHAPQRAPLVRVWVATGDPRQPLACRWNTSPQKSADSASLSAEPDGSLRLCA